MTLRSKSSNGDGFLEFIECHGCGDLFPIHTPHARKSKWCSQRCRRQTLYSTPCVNCGAPTDGSNGRREQRCLSCQAHDPIRIAKVTSTMRERARPTRELIERMWVDGATCSEIARALGAKTWVPGPYRAHGYELPYRRTPEQVARMRAARWPAAA